MCVNLKVCELILIVVRILSFSGLQLQCYYKRNFRAINGIFPIVRTRIFVSNIFPIVRTELPENNSVRARTLPYLFARKIISVRARVLHELSTRNFRANSKYLKKYANKRNLQSSNLQKMHVHGQIQH